MKLVSREELMALPPGTVYQSYEPEFFGEMMVKGETLTNDFSGDWYENPLGANIYPPERSFELDGTLCRDGLFDPGIRYLVMEPADVDILVAKLRGEPVGESTLPMPVE